MLQTLLAYLSMPLHIAKLGWGFVMHVNNASEPLRRYPFTPIRDWDEEIEYYDGEEAKIRRWLEDQQGDQY